MDFMGGGFTIKNPNAVSSCGCGSSFSCGWSLTNKFGTA
jgi:iron-sulfur cluster assembly protein